MSKTFSLEQLTEGIRARHLGTQNRRLVEKWSRTGLLRGLDGVHRENMACMLENQAAQVLKEASTLGDAAGSSTGHMRGFSNVAFPIVRRVFGGLIANDLVSIQPMSLPSGLLFYLDYTYGSDETSAYSSGESLYNGPGGKGVQSGSLGSGGMYDLAGAGYSKRRATTTASQLFDHDGSDEGAVNTTAASAHGAAGAGGTSIDGTAGSVLTTSGMDGRLIQFDAQVSKDIDEDSGSWAVLCLPLAGLTNLDRTMVKDIGLIGTLANASVLGEEWQAGAVYNLRRLNEIGSVSGGVFTANAFEPLATAVLKAVVKLDSSAAAALVVADEVALDHVMAATLDIDDAQGDALTIPSFEGDGAGDGPAIPEIDIKIEALAVTAQSRKLKAKWSPELAQDLNAYHSLDAEVELTQILSEQIALEIDREILNDLLVQGNGANLFWSRMPGKFVNKETGAEVSSTSSLTPGPSFQGTVREWYETLTETIIDAANTIHRKTLRGSANFIVVGPDVATILESSVMYRPSYSLDGEGQVGAPMTIGADKVGTLSNRFTVYKDPYFPRNKILVGYKGGSYLETGYVYAPYVPLIVTPTIFQPEDFTPRKGVMTRYGKKMVRSDFYGTITVMDMNVI